MYWLATTAPPVASAVMIWIIRVLKVSTRLTPDTAASPTDDTMRVSARPMVTLRACSAISGSSSAVSCWRVNKGFDSNFVLVIRSSALPPRGLFLKVDRHVPMIQRPLRKGKEMYTRISQNFKISALLHHFTPLLSCVTMKAARVPPFSAPCRGAEKPGRRSGMTDKKDKTHKGGRNPCQRQPIRSWSSGIATRTPTPSALPSLTQS